MSDEDEDAIDRAVEALQAKKRALIERKAAEERARNNNLLAPGTPSPRKKKQARDDEPWNDPHRQTSSSSRPPSHNSTLTRPSMSRDGIFQSAYRTDEPPSLLPAERMKAKSNFLSGISNVSDVIKSKKVIVKKEADRSDSFSKPEVRVERPQAVQASSKGKGREKEREAVKKAREAKAATSTMIKAEPMPAPRPKSTWKAPKEREEHFTESESDDDEDGLHITDKPMTKTKRRMDGTVIEELSLGPVDHQPIPGDPDFETIEPNSGIRLRPDSRKLTHEEVQSYLENRYHLTPSLVYSLSRTISQGSNSMHVEIEGGYVIIGVVAAKSLPMLTKGRLMSENVVKEEKPKNTWASVRGAKESDDEAEVDPLFKGNASKKKDSRYIRFTIVDLSTPQSAASGTGTLFLTMFQAEHTDVQYDEDGTELRSYRGGSGGAYEKHWKLDVGSVVAILNPSVSKGPPRPGQSNIFYLSPKGADSIAVIAQAKDLAHCEAMRRDTGTKCGDWCDARVHAYCTYHVEMSLKRKQASRPETNSSTASMANKVEFNQSKFVKSLQKGGKAVGFDPVTKTGLLPRNNLSMQDGLKTYVTRSIAGSSSTNQRTTVLTAAGMRSTAIQGSGGAYIQGVRDGPTVKAARKAREDKKLSKEMSKQMLKDLIKKDGGKTVAGSYLSKTFAKEDDVKVKGKDGKRKREVESESETGEDEDKAKKKKPFSTTALRRIGFDPTAEGGPTWADEDDKARLKRLAAITQLSSNVDRKPNLKPPPGPKIRSVREPIAEVQFNRRIETYEEEEDDFLPNLDLSRKATAKTVEDEGDSDDDLVVEGGPSIMPLLKRVVRPARAKSASPRKPRSPSKSASPVKPQSPSKVSSPKKSPLKVRAEVPVAVVEEIGMETE